METNTATPPDPSPWHPETDPTRLKMLGKLIEELNEASSAAARCIIQGIDEVEPSTLKPNREWLEDELADVIANTRLVIERFELNATRIDVRARRKYTYITRWLNGLTRPSK